MLVLCVLSAVSVSFAVLFTANRSPNHVKTMQQVYASLPNVKVEPLHFSAKDISGERLLAMMNVDDNGRKRIVYRYYTFF